MTVAALELMPILWVAIIILSVILELYSGSRTALWFAPAAAAALALAYCGLAPRIQTVVFFAAALLLALGGRLFTLWRANAFGAGEKKQTDTTDTDEEKEVTDRCSRLQ